MRIAFEQLDEKKIREGRPLKYTSDLGEIHSLAAARLLSTDLICSDDVDIREVITDADLRVINDDDEEELIRQHTLIDFCMHLQRHDIVKRSLVRKFFKSIRPRDMNRFDVEMGTSFCILSKIKREYPSGIDRVDSYSFYRS